MFETTNICFWGSSMAPNRLDSARSLGFSTRRQCHVPGAFLALSTWAELSQKMWRQQTPWRSLAGEWCEWMSHESDPFKRIKAAIFETRQHTNDTVVWQGADVCTVLHWCVVFVSHANDVTGLSSLLATATPPTLGWYTSVTENNQNPVRKSRVKPSRC